MHRQHPRLRNFAAHTKQAKPAGAEADNHKDHSGARKNDTDVLLNTIEFDAQQLVRTSVDCPDRHTPRRVCGAKVRPANSGAVGGDFFI